MRAILAPLYSVSNFPGCAPGVAITPNGRDAYVTNEDRGTVSVIKTSTNTVVTSVELGGGLPFEVAITPNGRDAYVTTGNTVSVVGTSTNKVVKTVAVGSGADGIAFT
jgi:YVTN family beta-propeller protein